MIRLSLTKHAEALYQMASGRSGKTTDGRDTGDVLRETADKFLALAEKIK